MPFPIALADYIAKACGLPSLFVGKYGDLEINYIWSITNADAWGRPGYSTIVVCSNKWIRGFNQSSGLSVNSHFVELNEYEDTVANLCRQYSNFPNARNVLDGYMLNVGFFEKEQYMSLQLLNPSLSQAPTSVQLDSAFEKTYKIIHEKSEQKIDVISQPLQTKEYPTTLIQFLISICIFDLSGIFEETNAPHDLEYILQVIIGANTYIFARTPRWFRGIKLYNNKPKNLNLLILEFNPPAINWYETLTKLQEATAPDFGTYLWLYQKSGVTKAKVKDFLKSDEQAPHWNILRRLIEILNQEE